MEELLPKRISFSLRELQDLGFLKIPTAKKLIRQKKIKAFKVGNKNYILRDEVLDFIKRNTSY